MASLIDSNILIYAEDMDEPRKQGIAPAIIQSALDLHQTRSVSFFDAKILQAAITSGYDTLYSEDVNASEVLNGVKIINPFLT